MSQEDLSTPVGLTRASVANLEKGRQRLFLHQLYMFADALGVALGDLLPDPAEVKRTGIMPAAQQSYLEQLRTQLVRLETKTIHRSKKKSK